MIHCFICVPVVLGSDPERHVDNACVKRAVISAEMLQAWHGVVHLVLLDMNAIRYPFVIRGTAFHHASMSLGPMSPTKRAATDVQKYLVAAGVFVSFLKTIVLYCDASQTVLTNYALFELSLLPLLFCIDPGHSTPVCTHAAHRAQCVSPFSLEQSSMYCEKLTGSPFCRSSKPRFDCDRWFDEAKFSRDAHNWRYAPAIGHLDDIVNLLVFILFVVTIGYIAFTSLQEAYFGICAMLAVIMFLVFSSMGSITILSTI
jgi:hypothetical protein